MTSSGLLLVLAAAFCHAGWNFLLKRINGGPELVWLFSSITAVLYLPAAIWVVLHERPEFSATTLVLMAGSVALHLGYFLLLQRGYRHGDLSVVYPTARATGPLLSTVFAVAVLGEQIGLQAATGGAAIIVGVLGLTGGIGRSSGAALASLGFGLAAGTLIAGYTVWDAYAVSVAMVPPILLDYVSSIGRTVVLAPLAWRRADRVVALWREQRARVIAVAALNPLAYILVLYAMTFTPVIYVAPTREVSVLISVLLGAYLLGEGELRRRLIWAVLIVAGVALLATG